MSKIIANFLEKYARGLNRRELFQRSAVAASASALAHAASPAASSQSPNVYQAIGVRPIINCRGTLTVVGGSLELPEVRAAKEAAALHFVQLDEMMEGIGKRLAEITGAEWGMVSAGCAAGLAHATTACITGGNPELHVRVPDLSGFAKDEVVIPKNSRNEYDQAIRSVGVRIIEVGDAAEYEAALGPKVAMVYILAGPRLESGPLQYDAIYSIAKKRNIPVLVDAAAEMLTIPNVHLQRGATLVGYSGGKCIRGPQCAGILLGRKDLIKAAWVASAPHHGHGRTMKLGKEEAMGMLAAIEMWTKRDHKAEMDSWNAWMTSIATRVSSVSGVQAEIHQPKGLSNHSPGLSISWDPVKRGITGEEVSNLLFNGEPRIALNGGGFGRRGKSGVTSISITAYMMSPGEDKIVGDKIHEILSKPRPAKTQQAAAPATDLTGQWDVRLEFAAGTANHRLYLKQEGGKLIGTYDGDFVSRDCFGTVVGSDVQILSSVGEEHGAALSYRFSGKAEGDALSGNLDMGEYLGAKWTATRHQAQV